MRVLSVLVPIGLWDESTNTAKECPMKAKMPLIQYPALATLFIAGKCQVHGCQTLAEAERIAEGHRYHRVSVRVGDTFRNIRDWSPESNDVAFWGN